MKPPPHPAELGLPHGNAAPLPVGTLEAKVENAFVTSCPPHEGQDRPSAVAPTRCSTSNRFPHCWHTYSYSGISASTSALDRAPRAFGNALRVNLVAREHGSAAPAPPEQCPSCRDRPQAAAAPPADTDRCRLLFLFRAHFSSPAVRVDSSSSTFPTAHLPPFRRPVGSGTAQVGTPRRGSTTHCRSTHATTMPSSHHTSVVIRRSPASSRPAPARSSPGRHRAGAAARRSRCGRSRRYPRRR